MKNIVGLIKMNLFILALTIPLLLTACSSRAPYDDITPAQQTTKPIMTKGNGVDTTSDLSENGLGANTSSNTDEDVELKKTDESIHSIAQLLEYFDSNWNESEPYQKAVAAYSRSIGKNTMEYLQEEYAGGVGNARMCAAYVDEDDIPELLLSFETIHVFGVHIFTYLPEQDQVVRVGEFGSFGGFSYSYKKNRLSSSYGNHGLYIDYVSQIESDGSVELIDAIISDGGSVARGEVAGFYGFSVPEGINGSREAFRNLNSDGLDISIDIHEDDFLITDSEKQRIYLELMACTGANDHLINVSYDNMIEISLQTEGLSRT